MECNDNKFCCNGNALLISPDTLKADSHLDENINDKDIRVAIKYVQDTIIDKVIGRCLFDSLKEMVVNDQICMPINEKYKYLLDNYLKDIFIWGVPAQLPIPLSYKIRNSGEIRASSENMSQADSDDINYNIQWYKNKMDFYVKRAIDYLCCHLQCYPELCCCCECGWYKALSKQPSIPINLKPVHEHYKLRRGYHPTGNE